MISLHEVPLLEIENKEKARVAEIKEQIASMTEYLAFPPDAPANELKRELESVSVFLIDDSLGEFKAEAAITKDAAVIELTRRLQVRQKHESEQAELARLRAESEARAKADHEARIAQDAADKATHEADENAEREATNRRQKENNERLQREAKDSKRDAAFEQSKRETAEALAKLATAAKDAKEQAEKDLLAKHAADKAGAEMREANTRHRAKINNAAKAALIAVGLSDADAVKVVTVIAEHKIPCVSINY